MTTNAPQSPGRTAAGGSRGRYRRLALVGLALSALTLEGCQGGGGGGLFSRCGDPCKPGLFGGGGGLCGGGGGGLCGRNWNPFKRDSVEFVQPSVISGDACDPALNMAPGGVILPEAPPTTGEAGVPELAPLTPAPTGSLQSVPMGSAAPSATPGVNRSEYQTLRPVPEPERLSLGQPGSSAGSTLDLIESLPAPASETKPTQIETPPASPAPPAEATTGAKPAEAPANASPPAAAAPVESKPETPVTAAPGIVRFSVVDTQLAGGSFPLPPGLDWLAGLSYKTILDLRPAGQITQDDITAIQRRGLRHVMFPVDLADLTPATAKRFESEIHDAAARPLYFCDADGRVAAALWYIHKRAVEKVDASAARRAAEELGALDDTLIAQADRCVEQMLAEPTATNAGQPAAAAPNTVPASVVNPPAGASAAGPVVADAGR